MPLIVWLGTALRWAGPFFFKGLWGIFKKSFGWLPLFAVGALTLFDKVVSKVQGFDFSKWISFFISLFLISFLFTFIGYILYYFTSFAKIFIDTFFFIFSIIGYHQALMSLFIVLLFGTLIFNTIKLFKSMMS